MTNPGSDGNDQEIELICNFLNERLGFTYGIQKKYLINARLNRRLAELNLKSYRAYLNLIKADVRELNHFFDLLTTNVTSFFREDNQFQIIQNELISSLLELAGGTKQLRCWSAGCSSGEEAYTLAIVLQEALGDDWDIKVLASDISIRKLEEGMTGIYSEEKLKEIPIFLREKYFSAWNLKEKRCFKVVPLLRKKIVFRKININLDFEIPDHIRFDLIICRNVFIYLANAARERALRGFQHYLKKDGFLLLGQSEPIHFDENSQWDLLKNCIYRKK
jgi:Methylase of chemotaxis methyl-accepting proteins